MNLQTLILTLAPQHAARSRVPNASGRYDPAMIAHDSAGMLVYDGASDATIYECPKVNHAFRAWHDACHIMGQCDFTLAGERAACAIQIRQARLAFPSIPASVLALIRAEVIGQAEHFERHGSFPVNQAAFIRDYMRVENDTNTEV